MATLKSAGEHTALLAAGDEIFLTEMSLWCVLNEREQRAVS